MEFINKKVGKDTSHISADAIRVIDFQPNNAKLIYVGGVSEDCGLDALNDSVLSKFTKCLNYGLNRNCIVYADVSPNNASVEYVIEGGGVFKFNDTNSVSNADKAIANAIVVNRPDDSKIYINPFYIDKLEKPFVTTKVSISSDAGREEIDAQIEGNPSIVVIVKLFSHTALKFSGIEARQILSQTVNKPKEVEASK